MLCNRNAAAWAAALCAACCVSHAPRAAHASGPFVLPADEVEARVESFNAADEELVVNLIPNAEAAAWVVENAPRFDCPSERLEEVFVYRWWTLRKHVKQTPEGRVLTEFITPVRHAGAYNTVSCALGHQIAEGRWLRDQQLLDELILFWLRGASGDDQQAGPQPHLHKFSSWLADAVNQRRLVTGDDAFALDLLDDLVADYERWEEERLLPSGLFWQRDVSDGMEESISGGRRVKNVRPTINAYMIANARAIAEMASAAGRPELAERFNAKADELLEKFAPAMWDPEAEFFKVRLESGELSDAREAIGFIPWLYGVASAEHAAAWAQANDPQGFDAPAGLTTAERRHPEFRTHGTGTCEWDGAVWPFATSQTLGAMASLLRGPEQDFISKADYLEHLTRYAEGHEKDGEFYIGEYHDEVTGDWLITGEKEKRSRYYNHSTFCDLVINGLVGVIPQPAPRVAIDPLVPPGAWDWFCLDGVPYQGRSLTVIWDRTGEHYGRGAGLSAWIDGQQVAQRADLGRLEVELPPR
ncbi:Glucosidase YgjK precursor [Pseudobythopirellula maris]|uniref:Glucosidase YgjK n=1 Tax=Pseudobythopirellula maris TaxID=2527991 RepID=A0A5C5ZU07_9BACT|nr:glycosyl hydrolase family 65 protein [Pseudobythopirellula maris]TWT91042.1 Glucosidase YgjK precursor [Pseudobythopirellula maris]